MKVSVDNQYKHDIFFKLNIRFKAGAKILDIGCGDGVDAQVFIKKYKLHTYGIDIFKHDNINSIKKLHFRISTIYNIPYKDNFFDYVFLHDVLHHIDEPKQRFAKHSQALKELKRICKRGGYITIVEGNRYNPLFYPHMVKILGHNHWKQGYFIKTVKYMFPNALFRFFEAHFYPEKYLRFFKVYEFIMEHFVPRWFLAYNVALIHNEK